MKTLWVEEFRPKTINDYVFRDDAQKQQVQSWVDSGAIPHLLFSGGPGAGKTTLGKVLLNELKVDPFDVRFINGSTENGVDEIRNTVVNFAMSMGVGDMKYIFIDEADYLTPNAQAALRHTMELYSNSCRFIFTVNYPNKIIPALHSRCQGFHIDNLDVDSFFNRCMSILDAKSVKYDLDVVKTYIVSTYPDMRKCINLMQQMSSASGTLAQPMTSDRNESDYWLEIVAHFRNKDFPSARKLICTRVQPEEYEDIFRFFYRNVEFWTECAPPEQRLDKERRVILAIRDGLVKHTMCADPEINLSATLVELEMIAAS